MGGKTEGGAKQQDSSGVNIIVNTTINVADGKVTSQETSVSSDEQKKDDKSNSKFSNDDAKRLTDSINSQITIAMGKESRPGGILYERFKTRG